MTEAEYLITANKAKICAAMDLVRDVLPGDKWGVSKQERGEIMDLLYVCRNRLADMIYIEDNSNE